MMAVEKYKKKHYRKGSIHIVESIIASLILISFLMYFLHTRYYNITTHEYIPYTIESQIIIGNISSLIKEGKVGMIKHINEPSFVFNFTQFPYVYIIKEGKIFEAYPKKAEHSGVFFHRINMSYYEVFLDCEDCSYDVVFLPYPLSNITTTIKDVVFYNNETAYLVIG